jgi:LysM repeat protein
MTHAGDDAMTHAGTMPAADEACPYLGLADDPATRFAYPSSAQRCHALARPSTIELVKQAQDCLTAQHVRCSRYSPPEALSPAGQLLREAVASPDLLPARSTVAARRQPPVRGLPRPHRAVQLALFAVLLVAVGLGGVMLGSRLADQLSGRAPGSSGSGGGAPAVSASPSSATPADTLTPAATPTPDATPTAAAPLATPTPSATPKPKPLPTPVVHVVKLGENLTQIAARYGVTVPALRKANNILDPNVIHVGQRLVIPTP